MNDTSDDCLVQKYNEHTTYAIKVRDVIVPAVLPEIAVILEITEL